MNDGKVVNALILCGLVMFMGYKMIVIDKISELDNVVSKESSLKVTYASKQARANQLPAFRLQLKEMQQSFGSLIKQLPSGTEIPGLILDISEKGLSNGLQIELFKPKGENQKEFYAEKPITLKAKGTYNQLAAFVSDISGLPRIVTISDIQLAPEAVAKDKKNNKKVTSRLTMQAVIRTYRYLDENEEGES